MPLLESARVLISEGYDPETIIEMWHAGASEFAIRAKLGVAAKLKVEESAHGPAFRSFRGASRSAVDAPPIRQNERAATTPADPLAARLSDSEREAQKETVKLTEPESRSAKTGAEL